MALHQILIEGLIAYTQIGIYEWEKVVKQKVIVDMKLSVEGDNSMGSIVVDYEVLSTGVKNFISLQKYETLEAMAENLATFIMNSYRVNACVISLHKPMALLARVGKVSVVLQKGH